MHTYIHNMDTDDAFLVRKSRPHTLQDEYLYLKQRNSLIASATVSSPVSGHDRNGLECLGLEGWGDSNAPRCRRL